jgi:hypothetical protein
MSKRKNPGTTGGSDGPYNVGYGNPPMHSRFRPGQSGNPAGRGKGVRNFATDVKRMLSTPVKVKEGGRSRTRSTQEAVLMVLREKALHSDTRGLERMLALGMRYNDEADIGPALELAPDDEAILAAYVADVAGGAPSSTMTSSDGGQSVKSGGATSASDPGSEVGDAAEPGAGSDKKPAE